MSERYAVRLGSLACAHSARCFSGLLCQIVHLRVILAQIIYQCWKQTIHQHSFPFHRHYSPPYKLCSLKQVYLIFFIFFCSGISFTVELLLFLLVSRLELSENLRPSHREEGKKINQ